jgi:hypothetical protein
MSGISELSLGEAVAVLLATWNRRFYQRGRRCDGRHVDMIDTAIRSPRRIFTAYLLAPKFFPLWDGGIAAEYWLLLLLQKGRAVTRARSPGKQRRTLLQAHSNSEIRSRAIGGSRRDPASYR